MSENSLTEEIQKNPLLKKKDDKIRVALNKEAALLIDQTYRKLKKSSCRLNKSDLASKVVELYLGNLTDKKLKALEKVFFSRTDFIKNLIKSGLSEDEIIIQIGKLGSRK